MFGLGKKKNRDDASTVICSPVAGALVAMDDIPDPVFRSGAVGQGFAVEPDSGVFTAPVSGEVTMIAPTGHAFGIRTDHGAEVLVHIGLDSFNVGVDAFRYSVSVGDAVECNAPVVEVDRERLASAAQSALTPVLVTNPQEFAVEVNLEASAGDAVMTATRK